MEAPLEQFAARQGVPGTRAGALAQEPASPPCSQRALLTCTVLEGSIRSCLKELSSRYTCTTGLPLMYFWKLMANRPAVAERGEAPPTTLRQRQTVGDTALASSATGPARAAGALCLAGR